MRNKILYLKVVVLVATIEDWLFGKFEIQPQRENLLHSVLNYLHNDTGICLIVYSFAKG